MNPEMKAFKMITKYGDDAAVQALRRLYLCELNEKSYWQDVVDRIHKKLLVKPNLVWE